MAAIDKHTLMQWIAGAEVRFKKTRKPLAGMPLVSRIGVLADRTQEYMHTEKIDLTRARDFKVQETSEDLLVASVDLPIFGKRGLGNDTGMAVATFRYTDQTAEEHTIIAICAYTISGVVARERQVKQVIAIPVA